MREHRIVCVTTEKRHGHVLSIGTGSETGAPQFSWPVTDVFRALVAGDSFYTVSPSTGTRAGVTVEQCQVEGCFQMTIRSTPESIHDNNIDNLNACKWI